MYRAVNVAAVAKGATVLALLFGSPAAAWETPRQEGDDRWVPSMSLEGGTLFQKQRGSLSSSCATGGPGGVVTLQRNIFIPQSVFQTSIGDCAFANVGGMPGLPSGPSQLRANAKGTDWDVSPFINGTFELMSPAFDIPGRPRLFVTAGAMATFASTRDPAEEGSPQSEVSAPDSNPNLTSIPQSGLTGVGSRTRSEVQTWAWGAGLGVAFPFELFGRQLRVKPSVGYIRYKVDVDGLVKAGVKNDIYPFPGDPFGCQLTDIPGDGVPECAGGANIQNRLQNVPLDFGDSFREVTLSDRDSGRYNGVGPALEVDLDAGRFGPIGVSVFMQGGAYRVLGNRKVELSDSVTLPPFQTQFPSPNANGFPVAQQTLPGDTYTAQWEYEVDPWLFRAGVGIRLHWLGLPR